MKPVPTASIDIDLQPGHAIRRLHQISVGIFMQEAGDLGVTPVQYAALQTVGNQPGIDQRTLARNIALDASTPAAWWTGSKPAAGWSAAPRPKTGARASSP